jgi:hypothetical protein
MEGAEEAEEMGAMGGIPGIDPSVLMADPPGDAGAESCTSDLLLQRARNVVVASTAAPCAVDHLAVEQDKIRLD